MATRPHPQQRAHSRFSPSFVRLVPWIAGAILLAGVGVFVARAVSNTSGTQVDTPVSKQPAVVQPKEPTIAVPAAARTTAQRFIETAVMRQNLRESWSLVHPELKQGYTLKQWLTGNIPVVPFTKKYFLQARTKVDFAHPNDILLEVAMLSTNDKAFKSQYFFLELKPFHGRWLVSSWEPRGTPRVPISPA